jgi:hypothetical protein
MTIPACRPEPAAPGVRAGAPVADEFTPRKRSVAMALLQSVKQWLGSAKAGNRPRPKQPAFRLNLEAMEERMVPSATSATPVVAPVLDGEWFVQSNGLAASISEAGGQLLLTNEFGSQTVGQWLTATTFQAWGYTAQVVQDGAVTEIQWDGNVWSQSAWQTGALGGEWFVQSDGGAASISEAGGQLLLTNEQGTQTVGQWVSPTSFQAWGYTGRITWDGSAARIAWDGNTWTQSAWQNGGLDGQWFVGSNGQAATISNAGGQLVLTNEQGQQTVGQWVSPTSFQAWGQTAQVTQSGAVTTIQWNGNSWTHSTWQDQGLAGQWFVPSDGGSTTIAEAGGQLTVTDEQGTQTAGQWLSPTTFQVGTKTAQVLQNGVMTMIQWSDGSVWSQSSWQNGGLDGPWFVASNNEIASIADVGGQLLLTNEQGTQTAAQWLSPTTFKAWGQTAAIAQNGTTTQIVWDGNTWTQSPLQVSGLGGQWVVQNSGRAATIIQTANQLILTNEQGTETVAQWLTPTTFEAWGTTAQVVVNGNSAVIQWDGNTWTKSA